MKRNALSLGALALRFLLLGFLVLLPRHDAWVAAQAPNPLSCSAPADETERGHCEALEAQVLSATVFMRFLLSCGPYGPRSGRVFMSSHGTVMDDRTVLTHDHFTWTGNAECTLLSLEVASARGPRLVEINDPVLLRGLADQLRPDPEGSPYQARTLTFPEPLFAPADVTFERMSGRPGAEVLAGWGELAEVNWVPYPRRTYVQWVKPSKVEVRGEALALVVQKAVKVGASGGGLFRVVDGRLVHVGNVWTTRLYEDSSVVALNQ